MSPLVGVLTALVKRFSETNLVAQSAALAFYALLSLAPLLLILLWITAAALPSAREAFLDQVGSGDEPGRIGLEGAVAPGGDGLVGLGRWTGCGERAGAGGEECDE